MAYDAAESQANQARMSRACDLLLARYRDAATNSEAQLHHAELDMEQLRGQLAEADAERDRLRGIMVELRQGLDAASVERDEAAAAERAVVDAMRIRLVAVEAELDEARSTTRQLQSSTSIADADRERAALADRGVIEELREQLVDADAERRKLSARLEDRTHLEGRLEESNKRLLKLLGEERHAVQQLQENLDITTAELDTIAAERQGGLLAADAASEKLRNQLASLQVERDQLVGSVAQSRDSMRGLRHGLKQERRATRTLRKQLQTLTQERDAISRDSEAFHTRLITAEAERDELASNVFHLRCSSEQREETAGSLRLALEQEYQSTAAMRSQFLESKQAAVAASRESAGLLAEVRTKLSEVEAERDQLARDRSQSADSQNVRGQDLQLCRAEADTLRDKLAHAEAECNKLKVDNTHLMRMNEQRQDAEKKLRLALDEEKRATQLLREQYESGSALVQDGPTF